MGLLATSGRMRAEPERLLVRGPAPAGGSDGGAVCERLLFSSEELVHSSAGNLVSYISESLLHMSRFYKKKPRTDLKSSMSSLPGYNQRFFQSLLSVLERRNVWVS